MNGHAYLLANEASMAGCMEVYELDLQKWCWRLLPCQGPAPPSLTKLTPIVVQVRLLTWTLLHSQLCCDRKVSLETWVACAWCDGTLAAVLTCFRLSASHQDDVAACSHS